MLLRLCNERPVRVAKWCRSTTEWLLITGACGSQPSRQTEVIPSRHQGLARSMAQDRQRFGSSQTFPSIHGSRIWSQGLCSITGASTILMRIPRIVSAGVHEKHWIFHSTKLLLVRRWLGTCRRTWSSGNGMANIVTDGLRPAQVAGIFQ